MKPNFLKYRARYLAAAVLAAAVGIQTPAIAQDGEPVKGGTLIGALNASSMPNFNTHMTSVAAALYTADLWADGLVSYDKDAKRVPRLATEWNISEDGKTYTFKLRDGIKWSDGQPFSSADVLFTLTAFAPFNNYMAKLNALIEEASAPDPTTFVVKLKQPMTATMDLFDKEIFPIMPKHIYEGQDIANHPANLAPVGLGPFKFQSMASGQSITFVRNENYWDGPKPYLDSVVYALIPNQQQRLNAIIAGEVNYFRPEASQLQPSKDAAASSGNFKMVQVVTSSPETTVVDINLKRDLFKDVKVRQALFHAIDRKRLAKDAFNALAAPTVNAIPVQYKDLHDPSVNYETLFPYDPEKAKQLLDEAGYPMKDGKRFSLELTAIARAPYDSIAQFIQSQWTAVGIDVKLTVIDSQLWVDKVYKQRDFDTSIISLTGRTNPVLGVDRSFLCNPDNRPFTNPTGYCNPDFDKVAQQAAAAPLGKQRPFYKQYAEIIARDLNQLGLVNTENAEFSAVSNDLRGIESQFNISFNTNPNWSEVWFAKK